MTLPAPSIAQSCGDLTLRATKQFVLLRHVEADLHGRFCGHSNANLTAQGRTKLLTIIHTLSLASISPATIWSSDLRRATETAEAVAGHFGMHYSTSPRLREMHFGEWEGLSWSEVESRYPKDARAWIENFPHHRPPGGEAFSELQTRVIDELQSLAKGSKRGYTLAVTHAGFIRVAIAWVLGMADERISSIELNHGAITVLVNIRSHWSLAAMNLDLSCFAQIDKDGED